MMETLATALYPTAYFVVATLMVLVVLKLANDVHRRIGGDVFPSDGLIREPAYTKRRRQRALEVDIFWHAVAVPTLLLAWHYAFLLVVGNPQTVNLAGIVAIVAAGVAALGYLARQLVRQVGEKRRLVLQTSAEVATGQAINQLMRRGYWVFHDLALGKHRIQHLIIGPAGIFVLETKAHRVPRKYRKANAERAEAKFDGVRLIYPDGMDTDPLRGVTSQSRTIGKWLSGKIDEVVAPQPVLALPGWYVHSSDWKNAIVCNPGNPTIIINASKQTRLDSTALRSVLENLKKQTRDTTYPIPAPQVPQ